ARTTASFRLIGANDNSRNVADFLNDEADLAPTRRNKRAREASRRCLYAFGSRSIRAHRQTIVKRLRTTRRAPRERGIAPTPPSWHESAPAASTKRADRGSRLSCTSFRGAPRGKHCSRRL